MFLWGAVVGVTTQWFLNMEIERYTLATGETALTGFSRLVAGLGPGLRGHDVLREPVAGLGDEFGDPDDVPLRRRRSVPIAIASCCSSASPDPRAGGLRRAGTRIILKVAAIVIFFITAAITAITSDASASTEHGHEVGQFPGRPRVALMLGAIAYAGAGGGQNLCQSNWIRDKRFGMGLRPAVRQPDHRLGGAGSVHWIRVRADGAEPVAVAGLVAVRQPRAAVHLRG